MRRDTEKENEPVKESACLPSRAHEFTCTPGYGQPATYAAWKQMKSAMVRPPLLLQSA